MKQHILSLLVTVLAGSAFAQKQIPVSLLTADNWTVKPQTVTFVRAASGPTMMIQSGAGQVRARHIDFTNGTLEFDVRPQAMGMSFFFRLQSAEENEGFYLRMDRAGQPGAVDGLQYAPYVGGVLLWNLLGHYQTNATFTNEAWNHIKVVVSGEQMRLYINSPTIPTLAVDHLEGNVKQGTIGFEGAMTIRNLTVSPDVDGLSPVAGIDPTASDPRYVRSWAVSDPLVTPEHVDFSDEFLPTIETHWQVLPTERRGLLNLSRAFGQPKPRRLVWLKASVKSATAQSKKVDVGFVDDVWVYLNGKLAYVDKNRYGSPIAKQPDGRCSVENTAFVLPLKAGNNELLIGVASNFYGWGVITRFADMDGITITPDPTFDARLVNLPAGAIAPLVGSYQLPDGRLVTITPEKEGLKLSGKTFITTRLYPEAETTFFARDYDLQVVFSKVTGVVTHFTLFSNGKPVMEIKRID